MQASIENIGNHWFMYHQSLRITVELLYSKGTTIFAGRGLNMKVVLKGGGFVHSRRTKNPSYSVGNAHTGGSVLQRK